MTLSILKHQILFSCIVLICKIFYLKKTYNLRKRNCKQKPISDKLIMEGKQLQKFDHMAGLPDEILLYIFSFLDVNNLYYNVRLVCPRWSRLSMVSSPWKNVTVDNEVSTQVLQNWIQFSPIIKHIQMSNRYDADIILEAMSKYSNHLESLTIYNCWGSTEKMSLRSIILCNLLSRCKRLRKINLERVKIYSSKFFKLLAEKKLEGKIVYIRYVGAFTFKQYDTIMHSISGRRLRDIMDIE